MKRERFENLLITMLVPIVLVLISVVAMIGYQRQEVGEAVKSTYSVLHDSARAQVKLLRTKLDGEYAVLDTLAKSLATQDEYDIDNIRLRMRAICEASSFSYMSFSLPDGITYIDDGRTMDLLGREYFTEIMEGHDVVRSVERRASEGGGMRFMMGVPMWRGDEVIGAVVGSYDIDSFKAVVAPNAFEQSGYCFIVNSEGTVLVSSDGVNLVDDGDSLFKRLEDAVDLADYELEETRENIASEKAGIIYYQINDQRRYAAYEPLGMSGWTIFNVVPAALVDSRVQDSALRGWMLIFIVLFVSGLIIAFIAMRESRAKRKLRYEKDQLRISEEEYRIASEHSGKHIFRYDIETQTIYQGDGAAEIFATANEIGNVPFSLLEDGIIAPESREETLAFQKKIQNGEKTVSCVVKLRVASGEQRWFHADATTVFSEDGTPVQAIVSFNDITEQREREIDYDLWRQAFSSLPEESASLYEYNLTRAVCENAEGAFLNERYASEHDVPDVMGEQWTKENIFEADRMGYTDFTDNERLLADYAKGIKEQSFDFRFVRISGETLWINITIHMVEYPDSSDIKGFVVFRDIDSEKRDEIAIRTRSEQDNLTHVLNRATFIDRVNKYLCEFGHARCAFVLLDIDGFKNINDTLGHPVGDDVLISIATKLSHALRPTDMIGRLGGDEFVLLLTNVPDKETVDIRAQQIRELVFEPLDNYVFLSASLGISLFPENGRSFDELYRCADVALYRAKWLGKNRHVFFLAGSEQDESEQPAPQQIGTVKNTLLIVDDVDINRDILVSLFKDEYIIYEAANGREALQMLHKYGNAITVVLLDIFMPEMDGFEVLKQMRSVSELSSVATVVISSADEADSAMHAIELGALDFVSKPVDAKLVKLRVKNAVRKRENERLRAQNRYLLLAREEQERYHGVLENTSTVAIEYDRANGSFTYFEQISDVLAGIYDERDLWQIMLSDEVASEIDVMDMRAMFDTAKDSSVELDKAMDVRLKSANGEYRWYRFKVRNSGNRTISSKLIITFTDVHEEIEAKNAMRYLAEFDGLTEIYNRNAFYARTEELFRKSPGGRFVIVHMDIDKFKVINNVFGHAAGDKLLRFIARRIKQFMDERAGTYCRIDSDNFAMCMEYSEKNVNELLDCFRDNMGDYELPFEIVIGFGAYIIEDMRLPVDIMLDRAELAERSVKGNYANRIAFYDDSLRTAMLEEQNIVGQMKRALDNGEFDIYLQPQHNSKSGEICGVEALVRWVHPEKGVIMPDAFIPTFEKNGFITALDECVWEKTCALLRKWIDEKKFDVLIPVSVNVSRMDIYNPRLCAVLKGMLEKYSLEPSFLRLEITESAYTENPKQFVEAIKQLRDEGFTIEMDDFGSGYSSLNVLKDMPVDTIKLDMRFLHDRDGERGRLILAAIVAMAQSLSLPIIAEGVETHEQVEFLKSIGCYQMQGYYYSKPIPIDEFEKLL